jgi:hypothetical protein
MCLLSGKHYLTSVKLNLLFRIYIDFGFRNVDFGIISDWGVRIIGYSFLIAV